MFDTHKLNEQGFVEVTQLKRTMAAAVDDVLPLMPEGRDKAVFKTKMEEAMFFATKSIATKEGNFTDIVTYGKEW